MMRKERAKFTVDADLSMHLDGWEVGSTPGFEDKNYVNTPSPALHHIESGTIHYFQFTPPVANPRVNGLNHMLASDSPAAKKEDVLQAPSEAMEALRKKAAQIEQETGVTNLVLILMRYVHETLGVNNHEFRNASEITVDGRTWLVQPAHYMDNTNGEIAFIPAVFDKETGKALYTVGYSVPEITVSSADDDAAIKEKGVILEELPSPVRKKLADLTQEMREVFAMPPDPSLYDSLTGAGMAPLTDEISAGLDKMLEIDVKHIERCFAPFMPNMLVKDEATGILWENSTQRIDTSPVSAFAIRPIATNMQTGEAFSLKIAAFEAHQEEDKVVREITAVTPERIMPTQERISAQEFCNAIPLAIRKDMELMLCQSIESRFNLRFSDDLAREFCTRNSSEVTAFLENDTAVGETIGRWSQQFQNGSDTHAKKAEKRNDTPHEGGRDMER